MPSSEGDNATENRRTDLQKFDYIEGSIKDFPEALLHQTLSCRPREFTTGLWEAFDSKQTLSKSLKGNPIKFVQNDDTDMTELPAGRFWFSSQKQIIVVGILSNKVESQMQYVIVRWRSSTIKPRGPENWSGNHWRIWRPEKAPPDYYDGIPSEIVRVERFGPAPAKIISGTAPYSLDVSESLTVLRLSCACIGPYYPSRHHLSA